MFVLKMNANLRDLQVLFFFVYMLLLRGIRSDTTPKIYEIFIGRCHGYLLQNPNPSIDCDQIWNSFRNVIVGHDPCHVSKDEWKPVMDLMWNGYPNFENETLFWSKTGDMAAEMGTHIDGYLTMADTLAGYLVRNDMKWCGSAGTSEFTFVEDSCPGWMTCIDTNVFPQYFAAASKALAEHSVGKTYLLLNASVEPIWTNTTFFSEYELPNFNPEITSMTVLISRELNSRHGDYDLCKTDPSLLKLQSKISQVTKVICQDTPGVTKHLQCTKKVGHQVCQFVDEDEIPMGLTIGLGVAAGVLLLVVVLLLILLVMARRSSRQ